MITPQRATEHLLLTTDSARALLQLRRDGGDFAIEAEAVQYGARQFRHTQSARDGALLDAAGLGASSDIQEDAPAAADSRPEAPTTRLRAPLMRDGKLVGVISLHRYGTHGSWSGQTKDALKRAKSAIAEFLQNGKSAAEGLRAAAIQAVLDQLRTALDVQRCTFRQPVEEAFAFPVTFESREAQRRSLLGDFTIVQTGQPVIVKLLAERAQVIQEDCSVASQDPLFHKMLAHYGDMRAQMVTPFIVGDQLKGVLSVHELRAVRAWTTDEKAMAAKAAALIGALAEVP